MIVSEQSDAAPNEQTTPGYGIFNLRVGLNLHNISSSMSNAQLTIGLTNIGDKAYRIHVSRGAPSNQNVFLEAGRSLNIAFVVRFGEHLN